MWRKGARVEVRERARACKEPLENGLKPFAHCTRVRKKKLNDVCWVCEKDPKVSVGTPPHYEILEN